jgi:aryl-alcohol dehydrogenase-like predicted oxidoreductase
VRYRQLGRSGLTVSVVALGCNAFGLNLDEGQSGALVHAALEAGVTLFDTAPNYGSEPGASERFLGAALRGHRDEVVVSTKVAGYSTRIASNAPASRRALRPSIDASLKRLGTDFIDLVYVHQPDTETPVEETLEALGELIAAGKVRYVASSNLKAWQIVEAELLARDPGRARFIGAQNAYSLIDRQAELEVAPVCERYGIGLAPYFPLAHGLLAGGYRRGEAPAEGSRLARRSWVTDDESVLDAVDAVKDFAGKRGLSVLEVALGGLAAKPAVATVVAGASKPEQVRANAAASDWVPSADDALELEQIAQPRRYVPLGSRTGHRRA